MNKKAAEPPKLWGVSIRDEYGNPTATTGHTEAKAREIAKQARRDKARGVQVFSYTPEYDEE